MSGASTAGSHGTEHGVTGGTSDDDVGTQGGEEGSVACAEANASEIELEVTGLDVDRAHLFTGLFERSCEMAGVEDDGESVALELSCAAAEEQDEDPVTLVIRYSVDQSLAALQVTQVRLTYVQEATFSYSGRRQWLVLRDLDDRLLLAIVSATSTTPWVEGYGQLDDLFDPVSVSMLEGRCPLEPGKCSAFGEQAWLRFEASDEALDIPAFDTGTVRELAVHVGRTWRVEPPHECEFSTDQLVQFAIATTDAR